MKITIAPSILSADWVLLDHTLRTLLKAGVSWLHLDVMDGCFVPNITFGPKMVSDIKKHFPDFILDVHLMICSPEIYVEDFADAGADFITFHYEATPHPQRLLARIKSLGKRAGIAINPATPPDFLEYIGAYADLVLVMTVNPGFGGQKLIPEALKKIEKVRKLVPGDVLIEVDGGISDENISFAVELGADIVVAGAFIFEGNPAERVKRLTSALEERKP